MGGVGPLVGIEGDPASDTVRSSFSASNATRGLNGASWFLRFNIF